MDIISYSIASKAQKKTKDTDINVLGEGVQGIHPHTKSRIDNLEKAMQGVVSQANQLIVNDAVNIMKAHAKFNAVAQATRYQMHNMLFEDFLTDENVLESDIIDTINSENYALDGVLGEISSLDGTNPYIVITPIEFLDVSPEKIILSVEEKQLETTSILGNYEISRDGGETFEFITPETLHYFDQKNPAGTELVLKAELPAETKLLNYGLTWS